MRFLGYSGCLLGRFYAVTGVFWLFVRAFLCSCWGVLVDRGFYEVARVFWLFVRVLGVLVVS